MTQRIVRIATLVGIISGGASSVHAAATPAQMCATARLKAASKYAACQAKALIKFESTSDFFAMKVASSKCRTKYVALWPKLQGKFSGTFTTCDQNRFTDNGTTVTDNLTALQWEKKTDDNTVHDKDKIYTSTSAGGLPANADGTAFDDFVFNVAGSCFANQCDWRLPTREEFQTIVAEPFPCTTSPCIAATFGPTIAAFHATTSSNVSDSTSMWVVSFDTGEETIFAKTSSMPVRAVRGGL